MIEWLSWSVQYNSESRRPWPAIAWIITALQRVSWLLEWWVSVIRLEKDWGHWCHLLLFSASSKCCKSICRSTDPSCISIKSACSTYILPLGHTKLKSQSFFFFSIEFKINHNPFFGVGMNSGLNKWQQHEHKTLQKLADKDVTTSPLSSCSIYATLIPISKIHTSLDGGMCLSKAPSVCPRCVQWVIGSPQENLLCPQTTALPLKCCFSSDRKSM